MSFAIRLRAFTPVALIVIARLFVLPHAESQISFTYQSAYSYLKGKDAGSLSPQWMNPGFDNSSWSAGKAPFRYGDGSSGVELTDMLNNYSTIYLRSVFQVTNAALLKDVNFTVDYDDGFVIWINGVMVLSKNAPSILLFNGFAPANHESGTGEVYTLNAGEINLVEGSNTIAVMCFNVSLSSTDFYFDLAIISGLNIPETSDAIDINFNVKSGFFDKPFDLILTSEDPLATIVYTLDGSNPQDSKNSFVSSSQVSIKIDPESNYGRPLTPSVIVRASALLPGCKPSKPVSGTYIFPLKIKNQTYPGGEWPAANINGQLIDLGIDTLVVKNPAYTDLFYNSLTDIPTISVITDLKNLFDPASGIYVNALGHGLNWEKECSVELIQPDGTEGFKINAGLRIRGGFSRQDNFPKHAFRLFFREIYGSAKLNYPLFGAEGTDQFDKIDLRSEQNYAWNNGNINNSFVREIFSRDTQRDMGQPYTRSRYFHLYLNGMYWGMYQTQERSEARYAASYFGGDDEDYDVIKVNGENFQYKIEATDGALDSWQKIWSMCNAGFVSNSTYYAIEGKDGEGKPVKGGEVMVDIDNLIDYLLIVFYSGSFDGPVSKFKKNKVPNNFYAIDNREDRSTGFTFYAHDFEHSLFDEPHPPGIGINENLVNIGTITGELKMEVANFTYFHPLWLHFQLSSNSEYRVRFADRAYNQFKPGGVFSPASARARLDTRIEEIDLAVIAESARWGDAKRGTSKSYTRNDQWIPEIGKIRSNFIPVRPGKVIAQLKQAELYPSLDAPVIRGTDGAIELKEIHLESDVKINIANPNSSGDIYYTLNGKDPRAAGGGFSSGTVFSNNNVSLTFSESEIVKARVFSNGSWSALTEVSFLSTEEDYTGLKVTEVHYHPEDFIAGTDTLYGKDFEFIEFKNTASHSINLSGLELDSAVRYKFPENTLLPPGGFFVVTSKPAAFYEYYGLIASGNFQGNLSNSGEEVLLKDSTGRGLINFVYGDSSPWPGAADGDGYSIVASVNNPSGDPADYSYWRSSAKKGGNPFEDNLLQFTDPLTSNPNLQIVAYPNPTSGIINVSVLNDENIDKLDLILSDLTGKIIYRVATGSQATIDITQTGIEPGVYILKMSAGKFYGRVRIVFVN